MKSVWKYPFEYGAIAASLQMRAGAKVVHVAMQSSRVTLWAEVDVDAPTEARTFAIIGTGHPIPEGFTYVGTVLDAPFVWHIYEVAA